MSGIDSASPRSPLPRSPTAQFIRTPGRYVGAAENEEEEGGPFEQEMARLTADLQKQREESARLEKRFRANLKEIGHGF
jgi:type I restriction enzyme M protein